MTDRNNSTEQVAEFDVQKLSKNMLAATLQYQTAVRHMFEHEDLQATNTDPLNLFSTFAHFANHFLSNPESAVRNGADLTKQYVELWDNMTRRILGEEVDPVVVKKDSRFRDEAWSTSPVFNFLQQSYFLNSSWINSLVDEIEDLEYKDEHKLKFYTSLLVDAMSPTNFAPTNPEVIRETVNTNGSNLVKGVENLCKDIEKSKGSFSISTANFDAFEVGKNLATTPGKIVYQNELIQLIQYTPTTDKVYKTPILINPPWINKYYILDLQEKNSLVKWLVDQGYTVFLMSWNNPDKKLGEKSFDDYMLDGTIQASEEVVRITGEKQIHFIGYCIGGTLLASTMAYLRANNKNVAKTATFLTTIVDFEPSEVGDLGVFIDDVQVKELEKRMSDRGYLEGHEMAHTFNMIRANDMIWSFYVNNYLMGKDPFPFDILYWNSDSTRLPAKAHSFYLRTMYLENKLKEPGGLELGGTPIDLRKIDMPTYLLATEADHIVPWHAAYKATGIFNHGNIDNNRFVLSGSGHVAGVVNPPAKKKYYHFVNDKIVEDHDKWLAKAEKHEGSWWTDFDAWLSPQSGKKVPARQIKEGDKKLPNAPGSYVKKK